MEFRILGPVTVLDGDRIIAVGGVRQRSLLALLLVHRNEPVSTDRLVEEIWGERPPDTAQKTVHVFVSQLRKRLGEGRIETRGGGYVLRVNDAELDVDRFEALLERARGEEPRAASQTLREALALFRGEPLQDLAYEPWPQVEIERLVELRLNALEQRIEADLASGRHHALVPEIESAVRTHPLREGLRAELMLALYRSGRQADALEAFRETRSVLDEQLGLEPGPELRELEQRILRQDPVLGSPTAPLVERVRVRRRLTALVGGGALLLAAAIAAGVVELTSAGSGSIGPVQPNSVAAIDPATDHVVASISVGDAPSDVAVGAAAVWVLSANEETLSKIDETTHSLVKSIPTGEVPHGVAVGDGSVWVTTGAIGGRLSLLRIDPASGVVDSSIDVAHLPFSPPAASDVVARAGAVWISAPSLLARVDERTRRVVSRPTHLDGPLAFGEAALWVTPEYASALDAVGRFDPRLSAPPVRVPLPFHPAGIAVGGGAVWVTRTDGDTVWRIDPRTSTVSRTITVGNLASGVAFGDGAVWVASGDGTVSRIDPSSNRVVATIAVGGTPVDLAVGARRVWVTVD